MKYIILFFILFFISFTPFISSQAPDTLWTKVYGGIERDFGYAVQLTMDGGYIISGEKGNPKQLWLLRTDSFGDTLWTKTYGQNAYGFNVQQTSDGGFVVVGNQGSNIWLLKTDSNGNILWSKDLGGKVGRSVKQTADSGYIVLGWIGTNNDDIYLIKTNSLGDTLWTKTYGGNDLDQAASIQLTTDGGFIISGWTRSFGAGFTDVWLIKTDANGDTLWTKTYGGVEGDVGWHVVQTSDGGYGIAGYTSSNSAGSEDFLLIRTDSEGDTIWTRTFGGNLDDRAWSLDTTADGGFIMIGHTWSFGSGNEDVWLIRVNSEGDLLWSKTLGDQDGERGFSIRTTDDDGYIFTGMTNGSITNEVDLWLVKMDVDSPVLLILSVISPNGGEIWMQGSTENISWTSENVISVKIELSINNGTSWSTITDSTASTGIYSWLVNASQTSNQALIRISDLTNENISDQSDNIFIIDIAPAVDEEFSGIPDSYKLLQNYPNPFNPSTTIYYGLPEESSVKITIYDVLGNEVMVYSEEKEAGYHSVEFNATVLPSGIYFYQLRAGVFVETKKMILLK